MGRSLILPVCLRWLDEAGTLVLKAEKLGQTASFEKTYYQNLQALVAEFYAARNELDEGHKKADSLLGTLVRAEATKDNLIPRMNNCRALADKLEKIVDDSLWVLPKYNEMLW